MHNCQKLLLSVVLGQLSELGTWKWSRCSPILGFFRGLGSCLFTFLFSWFALVLVLDCSRSLSFFPLFLALLCSLFVLAVAVALVLASLQCNGSICHLINHGHDYFFVDLFFVIHFLIMALLSIHNSYRPLHTQTMLHIYLNTGHYSHRCGPLLTNAWYPWCLKDASGSVHLTKLRLNFTRHSSIIHYHPVIVHFTLTISCNKQTIHSVPFLSFVLCPSTVLHCHLSERVPSSTYQGQKTVDCDWRVKRIMMGDGITASSIT